MDLGDVVKDIKTKELGTIVRMKYDFGGTKETMLQHYGVEWDNDINGKLTWKAPEALELVKSKPKRNIYDQECQTRHR